MAGDEIEKALVDIDDNGAGPLTAIITHRLREVLYRQVSTVNEGFREGMVRLCPDVPAGVTVPRSAGRPYACCCMRRAARRKPP